MLAGLDWLDSLSLTGLDGQNLNEIGLKNGVLIVDDQQRGNKWNFKNITLSLRRPSGGGVALSVGEEGSHAWSLRVAVGPQANGVRSVDIRADKVATANILLALRHHGVRASWRATQYASCCASEPAPPEPGVRNTW